MVRTNGDDGRLDLMRDELEPKLLYVMDDDEGNFVMLQRDRLLCGEEEIELEIFAIGVLPGEVDMHASLDPTLGDLVAIHSKGSACRVAE